MFVTNGINRTYPQNPIIRMQSLIAQKYALAPIQWGKSIPTHCFKKTQIF